MSISVIYSVKYIEPLVYSNKDDSSLTYSDGVEILLYMQMMLLLNKVISELLHNDLLVHDFAIRSVETYMASLEATGELFFMIHDMFLVKRSADRAVDQLSLCHVCEIV